LGRIATEGAVADRQIAAVSDDTVKAGRIAAEGAVADRHWAEAVDGSVKLRRRIAAEGTVADRKRATVLDGPSAVRGGVTAEDTVADRHLDAGPVVDGSSIVRDRITDEDTITDRQHAGLNGDGPAIVGGVAAEGAVGHVQRPREREIDTAAKTSTPSVAVGDGQAVQREVDAAAADVDHLHVVLAIKGNRLAAAIQGHAPCDLEGVGQSDIPTAPKGDSVAGIVGAGLGDRGVKVRLVTGTDGDR
jgi:hypothetical protein